MIDPRSSVLSDVMVVMKLADPHAIEAPPQYVCCDALAFAKAHNRN
jgi:hypothetical protein